MLFGITKRKIKNIFLFLKEFMMKRIIALLVALTCVIVCFASCEPNETVNSDPVGVALRSDDIPFTFYLVAGSDGKTASEASVFMWNEVSTSIIVPETIEYNGHTYPVTRVGLGQGIAAEPSTVTKVVIPKSVKVVSKSAFTMCDNLLSVSLAEGVEVIEGSAFSMTGLTTIIIPSTVKTIEKSAFFGCRNLHAISVNKEIETIEDGAFSFCPSLEEVQIPRKFESRMSDLFSHCATVIDGSCKIIYTDK